MKNVFLITVDDLRAKNTGHLGYHRDITPNLDKFAQDNISFSEAIACGPMTTFSFPSILYSLYSSEYRYQKKHKTKMSLASFFKEKGYTTAAFNSNPHFKQWGYSKGFQFFEDFLDKTEEERESAVEKLKDSVVSTLGKDHVLIKYLSKMLGRVSNDVVKPYADAKSTTERVSRWISKNKDEPLFCWIHYMDPHYPFMPPDPYTDIKKGEMSRLNRLQRRAKEFEEEPVSEEDRQKLLELYDSEIRFFDEYLGRLFKRLKDLGLYEDSIIAFTSDHGELFGEHDRFGHQRDVLYQIALHVPLIVKTPANISKDIQRPVSLIDIPHTLADISRFKSPFRGVNLWKEKREYIISEGAKRPSKSSNSKEKESDNDKDIMISCQRNNWKLIVDYFRNKKELYDLEEDPDEKQNLYEEKKDTDIVSHLNSKIKDQKKYYIKDEKREISSTIDKLKSSGKI